ncbi:hypothetical protein [Agromyces sp. SYSU T00194]|uniref:hypothetical protein n=1 Tax=Agromyces chitinivorans TaxID=3158560 RepID=UPI00339107C1
MSREVWRPTEDELVRFVALHGALGLYSAAREAGVDAMRAEARQWEDYEEALYQAALALGFDGVGLGRRRAIEQVFEFAARNRPARPADAGEAGR